MFVTQWPLNSLGLLVVLKKQAFLFRQAALLQENEDGHPSFGQRVPGGQRTFLLVMLAGDGLGLRRFPFSRFLAGE